ncbi:MAG TPA: hypothetical protein VN937_13875, partial [Blastocatellia bacterium]|nr:hypothetical protein [Blastocatellia bacterium]
RTTEAKKAKKGIGVTTSEVDHNICAKRASTRRVGRRCFSAWRIDREVGSANDLRRLAPSVCSSNSPILS